MFARQSLWVASFLILLGPSGNPTAFGQVVPGTGQRLEAVGDTFEDQPDWRYEPRHPKSSRNLDKKERGPLAVASNGRWLEGPHRGTPDVMRLVPTPPGGLPGSSQSLLMRTRASGVPGKPSFEPQQDDVMVKVKRIVGRPIPASWSPNCVVRVYVPPFEFWERRRGASFGFRTDVWGRDSRRDDLEQYWPGLFVNLAPGGNGGDSAFLMVRGDQRGRDVRGPEVRPGWWTMGLSVSPDGRCHFYAREGIDDLSPDDRLGSYYCYGKRAERMDLFFFNVVSMDDGRTWSTPWIIDDPLFFCQPPRMARMREAAPSAANVRRR